MFEACEPYLACHSDYCSVGLDGFMFLEIGVQHMCSIAHLHVDLYDGYVSCVAVRRASGDAPERPCEGEVRVVHHQRAHGVGVCDGKDYQAEREAWEEKSG